MADRVSASIVIGGDVSNDQYQTLCTLILDKARRAELDGEQFISNPPSSPRRP
jgi:major membrane immunogen (membrane-anchored lipoprotein)